MFEGIDGYDKMFLFEDICPPGPPFDIFKVLCDFDFDFLV